RTSARHPGLIPSHGTAGVQVLPREPGRVLLSFLEGTPRLATILSDGVPAGRLARAGKLARGALQLDPCDRTEGGHDLLALPVDHGSAYGGAWPALEPDRVHHVHPLSVPQTVVAQEVSATVAPHVLGRLLEHHGAEAAPHVAATQPSLGPPRSEEHTSELQS